MHKLSSLLTEETIARHLEQNTKFLTSLRKGDSCVLGTGLSEQSMNLIL